jgi:hypothetical protein
MNDPAELRKLAKKTTVALAKNLDPYVGVSVAALYAAADAWELERVARYATEEKLRARIEELERLSRLLASGNIVHLRTVLNYAP